MTLFPRGAEVAEMAPEARHAEVADVIALIEEGTDGVVVNGLSAPNVHELPANHTATPLGSFEGAKIFYLGVDSLGNETDTMYMG